MRRRAIYKEFIAGRCASQVVRRLRLPANLVAYHKQALLGMKAIKPMGAIVGIGSPKFYERGPRAEVFEAGQVDSNADRRARSGDRSLARAHRGHRVFKVEGAPANPAAAPTWRETKPASGVPHYYYRYEDEHGRWTVRFSQGKAKQSVTVYPPDQVVQGTTLPELESAWNRYVRGGAQRWAAIAGFRLCGQPKEAAPLEVGMATSWPTAGQAGVDPLIVDGSPPDHNELESNLEVMAALARVPDFMAVTEARYAVLAKAVLALRDAAATPLRVLEPLVALAAEESRLSRGMAEVLVHHGAMLEGYA